MVQLRPAHLLFELLWWLIALAITGILLLPPYLAAGPFRYSMELSLTIVGLVTWARMLFFTAQTIWLRPAVMKGAMCIICVGVFLFAVLTLNNIQNLVDAEGFGALFYDAFHPAAPAWGRYLNSVTIFSAAGLALSCIGLPIVLVIRIWQQIKTQLRERRRTAH